MNLLEYRNEFEKLNIAAYKDLFINNACFRILGVHLMEFGADWNVKKHKHSFFEAHYVTERSVYTTLNGVEYEIRQNHFYIMPPGLYHSHRQEPGTSHIGFALRWEYIRQGSHSERFTNSSPELDKIVDGLMHSRTQPVEDDGTVLALFKNLLAAAGQEGGLLGIQLAFLQAVIGMARFSGRTSLHARDVFNPGFLENHIVNGAIGFLEENYNQDIGVQEVSSAVHMSYSHLSRLFKKYTGESVAYHLNRIRLAKSQRLLVCSEKSVAQIAREVGFNSEQYFISAFKKAFGVSPGSYRSSKSHLSE